MEDVSSADVGGTCKGSVSLMIGVGICDDGVSCVIR